MPTTILNDRYQLGEEVGRGGMAITYRARDTLLNRTVAVKVMREQFSADPDFVARFRREAQAAASLSQENIASVYDTGADAGRQYIVMEFVPGESLEQRLRRQGPLEPLAAIEIALQVVGALESAHRRGIVHRDVKPHNCLLDPEGRVKVTDFGIAKAAAAASQTATGTIMGSVHYFSPEQARGDAVGPQSDLYSLGIVLFEAVTGRRPFEGENPVAVAHKQIYDQPPRPSQYRPELPRELESIILRCMEKSLARRYATAAELRGYLLDARERLQSPGRRTDARRRTRRANRRAAWLGALVVAAALAGAAYMLVVRPAVAGLVEVPDLGGLDAASAQRLAADAGLVYRAAARKEYAALAPGLVARQEPRARARAARGSSVTVWRSQGPRYATVPDVTRRSLPRARDMLRAADLETGRVVEQYDDSVPAGRVASSEPGAGEQVDRHTRVALIVSRGPEPSAPEAPPGGPAEATIVYTVPRDAGDRPVRVVVELVDDNGKRVLYDAQHMAGDELPPIKARYTGRAVARVLVGGRERWSQVFGPEAPAAAGSPTTAPSPEAAPSGNQAPAGATSPGD